MASRVKSVRRINQRGVEIPGQAAATGTLLCAAIRRVKVMLITRRLQGSRYELKYIIDEAAARNVRDFALGYLEPDQHVDITKGTDYAVHSLYLDSPGLDLCRATLHGLKNRYKLRIRYYDDSPDTPAFLEIKRRENDVILKQRVPIRKSAVQRVLHGHWPDRSDILDQSAKGMGALTQFCRLRTMCNADGKTIVSYMREAYVTPTNDTIRVTFDRRLSGSTFKDGDILTRNGPMVYPEVGGVILEIKFTCRFPVWMRQLVRSMNLTRCSMAKYVKCMLMLRIPQLQEL